MGEEGGLRIQDGEELTFQRVIRQTGAAEGEEEKEQGEKKQEEKKQEENGRKRKRRERKRRKLFQGLSACC